jgi:5-methylcytosine-specific restriction endonuclease McrA
MTAYGLEHRRLRAQVLLEEPYCPGYPADAHDGTPGVRATELDHVVPLTQGGQTVRANARGLCRSCNRTKSKDDRAQNWRRG